MPTATIPGTFTWRQVGPSQITHYAYSERGIEAILYWTDGDLMENTKTGDPVVRPAGWYVITTQEAGVFYGLVDVPAFDSEADPDEQRASLSTVRQRATDTVGRVEAKLTGA